MVKGKIKHRKKMKRIFVILIISVLTVTLLPAQKKLVADAAATTIVWHGHKIVGSSHTGNIDLKNGWLTVEGNALSGGEFIVDMSSLRDTDLKDDNMRGKLEGHLKSDDFFGVEKFPVSKLTITGSTRFSGGKAVVKGNLTIKEATHPVEFTATETKNGDVVTYTADITFDRSLYDVRFGSGKFFSNLGDNAIVDEINLNVKLVVK